MILNRTHLINETIPAAEVIAGSGVLATADGELTSMQSLISKGIAVTPTSSTYLADVDDSIMEQAARMADDLSDLAEEASAWMDLK